MPDIEWVRVTDEVKPKREYSIVASTFDKDVHKKVDKPATEADGTPLPPKYTPESLAGNNNRGQSADTKKES